MTRLLVTGDSLAMPLDVETRAPDGRRRTAWTCSATRTWAPGISKSGLVDWGKLSIEHVRERKPDAVVVFIGANEGFPLPGPGGEEVDCCGRSGRPRTPTACGG